MRTPLINGPSRGELVDQGKATTVAPGPFSDARNCSGRVALVRNLAADRIDSNHNRHGDRLARTVCDRIVDQLGDDGHQIPAGRLREDPEALPNGLARPETRSAVGREHEAEFS